MTNLHILYDLLSLFVLKYQVNYFKNFHLYLDEIDKFLDGKQTPKGESGRMINLKKDVRLLLQVHDELVYEIKDTIIKSVAPEIQSIMENIIDPKKISGVVCTANISVGDNWGEMKSVVGI